MSAPAHLVDALEVARARLELEQRRRPRDVAGASSSNADAIARAQAKVDRLEQAIADAVAGRRFVVQAFNGRTWRKVRGDEGGPWDRRQHAERIATARAAAPMRASSTEGMPHRVVEVDS